MEKPELLKRYLDYRLLFVITKIGVMGVKPFKKQMVVRSYGSPGPRIYRADF